MSAGHSLPFFLSGGRRWITLFFFSLKWASSLNPILLKAPGIQKLFISCIENRPQHTVGAESICWQNEYVSCLLHGRPTEMTSQIDNHGNSDILDLGDLLLRAIQKFCRRLEFRFKSPKSDSRPVASRVRGNQRLPWSNSPRDRGSDREPTEWHRASLWVVSDLVGHKYQSAVKCLQSSLIKVYLTTWEVNQKIPSIVYF